MLYRLVAATFAPLLLVQGLYVRQVTPRLPEPPGPRSGVRGRGPALRLLVAGDSAAAGVGARSQEEALSGALARELATDYQLSWAVHARTGIRTRDALVQLAAAVAQPFDVALLSLGVNDVTGATRSRTFLGRQRELAALLRERYGVHLVLLTCLPPMHAFPALPQPLRWVLGERARDFTRLLESVAATDNCCEVLFPPLPLERAFIAPDGFHPGPPAYRAWAAAAGAAIRRRFPPVA